jgi:hypothetical protein
MKSKTTLTTKDTKITKVFFVYLAFFAANLFLFLTPTAHALDNVRVASASVTSPS